MPSKKDILTIALNAVADRGLNYGKPEDNFERIARLWNAHLINAGIVRDPAEALLDAGDVAMMCALLKIARLEHQPDHLDSWVDLAGYAACGGEIAVTTNPQEVTHGGKARSVSASGVLLGTRAGAGRPRPANPGTKVRAKDDGDDQVPVRNDSRASRRRRR